MDIVSSSAEGPVACNSFLEIFRLIFDYLEIAFIANILVKAYEKGENA